MADAPTTDEIGRYIRDALDNAPAFGAVAPRLPGCIPEPEGDEIEGIDPSDPSNIRIHMESGAAFVVRVIREG